MSDDPEVQYLTLAGKRYAYRRAGQGPPIILLHGLGETSRVFWRGLFSRLQSHYTLLALDIPGFGESEKPPGGYTPAAGAEVVAGLLEHLNLEKPVLLGHSLGGIIATRFAIRYPADLSHLIIYSTPIPGDLIQNLEISFGMPSSGLLLMSLLTLPGIGWLLHQNRNAPLVRMLVDNMRVTHNTADYTDEMVEEGLRNTHAAVTQWIQQGFLFENQRKDLHHIRVPTLLIRGEHDLMPHRWMENVKARIADAQLVTIAGAAHTALVEQPDRFIEVVTRFLDEHTEK